MKTIQLFLVGFVCLFWGVHIQAQSEFGVKGGINLSSLAISTSDAIGEDDLEGLKDLKYKLGYHAGAYCVLDFGAISVMPEILYSLQGTNKISYDPSTNEYSKANLHYITVPIMVGIQPVESFHIQLGPQIGYLFRSYIKSDSAEYETNQYDDFDFGLALGLAFEMPFGGHISGKYIYGLAALDEWGVAGSTAKYQNRNIMISVGFPLSGGDDYDY